MPETIKTRTEELAVGHAEPRACGREAEQGFLLVGLVVAIFFVMLALSLAAPTVAKQLQREREIEAMQRGKQYVRAIQLYYRKTNTYPGNMEALGTSNNIRYLRQQYVDPMTGKADWRLIHVGEAKTTVKGFFGKPLAGLAPGLGTAAGLASSGQIGAGAAGAGPGSAFGGSSGSSPGSSAFGSPSGPGGSGGFGSSSGPGGSSAFGGSGSSAFGSSSFGSPGSSSFGSTTGGNGPGTDASGAGGTSGGQTSGGGPTGSTDGSLAGGSNTTAGLGTGQAAGQGPGQGPGGAGGIGFPGSSTGGGSPFVGVGLPKHGDSIVVLNEQKTYQTWEFIYDPRIEQLKSGANILGGGGPVGGNSGGLGSASSFSSGIGGAGSPGSGFGQNSNGGFGNSSNFGSSPAGSSGFGSSGAGAGASGFGSSGAGGSGSSPQSALPRQ